MSSLALFSIALIAVGLYGVLAKVNLLKVVMGLVIMCLGIAGLVIGAGSAGTAVAPVLQTVGLVAIVGGASVASLLIVTAVRQVHKLQQLIHQRTPPCSRHSIAGCEEIEVLPDAHIIVHAERVGHVPNGPAHFLFL